MLRIFVTYLMLTTFVGAVQPPPHLVDNVRFARLGEATGRLSDQRFFTTVTLVAAEFNVSTSDAPRILVIHCDDYYGSYVHVDKKMGMALFTPDDTEKGGYELWIEGEGTDQKFVTAITNVYGRRLGKSVEEMEAVAARVMKQLAALVDVHDLKNQ